MRFFAGGDRSVRGFGYSELSPVETVTRADGTPVRDEDGNPVTVKTGGKHLLTGTFEIQRDLPRNFGLATFFDFGNAFDKFGDPLEYSAGIGFRWRLPAVTLGVDIAQPLSRSEPHRDFHQLFPEAVVVRRWIFIIFGVALLIVVSVPTAVIYYLAYTEPGLQWIVAHVPRRIGRTQMEFVGATGTLAKGFRVERFELEHERVHLRFEGAVGHVTLLPLMRQTIHAEDVTMRSAYVEVRRWKNPPPRSSPRFLPRGLIIEAEKVHVNNGTFIAQNGRRFDLTDVNTSGVARHRTIRLFDASFVQDAVQVSGKATMRAEEPMGLDADARMVIRLENQPVWLITATGDGNLDHLPITATFQSPLQATVIGSADDLTTAWHWSGDAKITNVDLRARGPATHSAGFMAR